MNKCKLTTEDIGKEYFTYYLQLTNRGNRYLKNTKIFSVKLIDVIPDKLIYIFEIKGRNHLDLINSYHAQSANFVWETREQAECEYDQQIKNDAINCSSSEDRMKMMELLINKPDQKSLALIWYKGLSKEHKEFIKLL